MTREDSWDEFKERVRGATDIVALVGRYVQLKRSGRTMKACCPFHQEKTPSFHVYPDRQFWKCYGACSEGGDVFTFLQKIEGVDFREALMRLADAAGIQAPARGRDPEQVDEARREREQFLRLQREAAAFFRGVYLDARGVGAREYASGRGVTGEVATDFELGLAQDSFDALCGHLRAKGFRDADLVRSGLAVEREDGSAYDRFRGRLMFPIRDDQGRTVGFGGRMMGEGTGGKYINSPEHRLFEKRRLLYGLDRARGAIREAKNVVVCEGYLDVIGAHQAGFANVVATLGTALTPEHLKLLQRFSDRVILAFDGDAAGQAAGRKAAGLCLEALLPVRVMLLPDGKDVADLCLGAKDAEFKRLMDDAVEGFQFLLDQLPKAFDFSEAQGKSAAARAIMEQVSRVDDEVAQVEYKRRVADVLLLPEQSLERYLKETQPLPGKLGAVPAVPAAAEMPITPVARAERELVEFLLMGGAYLEQLMAAEAAGRPLRERLTDPVVREIIEHLRVLRESDEPEVVQALMMRLDAGPAKSLVNDMLERGERSSRASAEVRFDKALSGLCRLYMEAELGRLEPEARRAEQEGRQEDSRTLKRQISELYQSMQKLKPGRVR